MFLEELIQQIFLKCCCTPGTSGSLAFFEGGETVNVSDGGGEVIPPLGGQTGEELGLGAGAHLQVKERKT